MKLTNISVVKDLMKRHGFSFTKSLGQNFLINPSVCPRMAAESIGGQSDVIIEIGAGIGVLTRELSKVTAENDKRVIVIEIDKTLQPILSETLAERKNVEIIWGDALELLETRELHKILAERKIESFSVCANLPYYAATHIIMKLLESNLPISSITAMVQEEVAQRFTAAPANSKQYGIVSVAARFYSAPKLLFKVSRGSFMPAPNVDSAVIKLDILNEKRDCDSTGFFRLVKAAFSERRKQLCNPVSKELGAEFGITKETVRNALTAIGKNPTARAEELSVDEFIGLYESIKTI